MDNCLFCKIVAGDIPTDTVYENDQVLAFRDIDPKAPTHILIIPKEHISTTNDLAEAHKTLMGEMLLAAKEIAGQEGIADSGYRTVFNCNSDGGQTVYHIHLHLLGGRQMKWPPG
ncbi:MAG TPA: histidine triad nucleotide-binding protein [Candidatus Marinimicrobia bacterium]|jgi:histidine triad (HIT) family protein|nr:histidine triad nucleotide-binding protein [Candidatus Neomarinimicrobiota bacterium]MDP7217670.1 histidine triad nucleotide-binding protein [Candidatus Neomarinimicrobiota bacterium]MDP7436658.1 histidine triad nucleotide-binding protein [Candidatus Neomarinimicrobiota bacterium]MDP7653734.1 histidine triad nucleotide-binding protein [Candidatus Neomarinimicrobiota bacterium]HBN45413.1 histidine triad nucleotide-binding protein [Candidatus Neomarinimicrobiota bacterium]|tara:strand:- start:9420 stop:9764 length:345 start_codon:yes stop_codon:yes gene_type:complete